ncbi:MAG: SOS response-associated peptidase [Endozoicomonas sp.]
MCGRYTLTTSEIDLSWLGINKPVTQPPAYNIAPGEQVLVARQSADSQLEAVRVKWGLVPPWLKDFSRAQINARVETAASKPMFREAMSKRRCLVLADGWYDWQALPNGNQPWYIRSRQPQQVFVGIWERYVVDAHLSFDSCAILTVEALPSLKPLSDRMPVLADRETAKQWLSGAIDHEQLVAAMRKSQAGQLVHHPVSRAVNRVAEKRAVCVSRL